MTNQVRDLLAKALPDTQPTSLTAQHLVSAGRRRLRRRRIGYLGGGTTAVALVAAGGLLLPPLLDGSAPPAGPVPLPEPPAAAPDRYPTAPPTIEELGDVIRGLVAAEVPDLQLSTEDSIGEPFDLAPPGGPPDGVPYLEGVAFLETSQGEPVGWVSVSLYRPGPWSDEPATTEEGHLFLDDSPGFPVVSCWSGSIDANVASDPSITTRTVETRCDESTTAEGDQLIEAHLESYYPGVSRARFSWLRNTAVVFRSDGTAVRAMLLCSNEAEDDDPGNHCRRLRLTTDQLASIVTSVPTVPAG